MKRISTLFVLVIILLTSVLPTVYADEIEMNHIIPVRTKETAIGESGLRSMNATVQKFITNTYSTIYTCPVRKNHVFITWNSSEGPTDIEVKIEILNNGIWSFLASTTDISLGGSCHFDFTTAYRYKISVRKTGGYDGNCRFTITATN